jgi:cytochrome c oxidase subunit IV
VTKDAAFRLGWIIFIALAVLTLVEYVVGIWNGSFVLLSLLALAKAGLIVYFFMHVYRLWREESH